MSYKYEDFKEWLDSGECHKDLIEQSMFIKYCFEKAYPIGVSWDSIKKKFMSRCNNGTGKQIYLGYYPTPEQAFQAYKEYKESLIKQISKEEYEKGNIIKEVYDNLMIYEVVPFPE